VKLRTDDQSLVPPSFFPLTRQKNVVPFCSGPMGLSVSLIVESSTTIIENHESSDTCNRYVDAPIALSQLSVGLIDTLFAPFAGTARLGADGGAVITTSVELAYGPP
jgi:hypothetical protein